MSGVRRIITGAGPDGLDTFVTIEAVEAHRAHMSWYGILGWNDWPQLPVHEGDQFEPTSTFPSRADATGVRVSIVDMPPGRVFDPAKAAGDLPSDGRFVEYRPDGMHRTNTIDLIFIIDGEVTLTAEDGMRALLKPGDCVVQNGRIHAWNNESGETCRLGFVILSADPRGMAL
jgi:hypothetical protein